MTNRLNNMPLKAFAAKDTFLSGQNANYADHMYAQWQEDPNSVHASWNAYFSGLEGGEVSFETPSTLGKTGKDAQLEEII